MMAVSQKYPKGPQPNGNQNNPKNPFGNPAPEKRSKGDSPRFRIVVCPFLVRRRHLIHINIKIYQNTFKYI